MLDTSSEGVPIFYFSQGELERFVFAMRQGSGVVVCFFEMSGKFSDDVFVRLRGEIAGFEILQNSLAPIVRGAHISSSVPGGDSVPAETGACLTAVERPG